MSRRSTIKSIILNEEEEEEEEQQRRESRIHDTGGLSDEEILKYVKMSPNRSRSLPRRSQSRMIIVESNPPRRRQSRRRVIPSKVEYYIAPQDYDEFIDNFDYYDDDDYEYYSPRSESNYKRFTPNPPNPPRDLSRNRIYNPSNLGGRTSRAVQDELLTNAQRRQRNQVRLQNAIMKNPVNKNNHRREIERVDYRDPPTSNKAVIRGGAVVYR